MVRFTEGTESAEESRSFDVQRCIEFGDEIDAKAKGWFIESLKFKGPNLIA
jgi:hypothetical protein